MPNFGRTLKKLRLGKGLTQTELANRAGLSLSTISNSENDAEPEVSEKTQRRIAEALELTLDEFRQLWTGQTVQVRGQLDGIPVINKVPAGEPVDYTECGVDSGQGYEYLTRTPWQVGVDMDLLFAVVVVGDSMSPEFLEGDYLVFKPILDAEDQVPDGTPVFVRFGADRDHECTFKRAFSAGEERIELRPDNRKHLPLVVERSQIERMSKLIEVRRRYLH
jgi:transcriptional regulator with XRE-family HTH domain